MKHTFSASELKDKVSDILNDVYFKKRIAIIERYGKPIAKIVPVDTIERSVADAKKAVESTFGVIPDFPDVTKDRVSRKKSITL